MIVLQADVLSENRRMSGEILAITQANNDLTMNLNLTMKQCDTDRNEANNLNRKLQTLQTEFDKVVVDLAGWYNV